MDDKIKAIEHKLLDFSKRTRDEHPAKALSLDDRETYAQFLEEKGHVKGAASMRSYVVPAPTTIKKGRKRK